MAKKQNRQGLNWLDGIFLLGAAVFLASAIMRSGGMEQVAQLRARAVAFCMGEFPIQEVVQAFGTWEQTGDTVQSVFHAVNFAPQAQEKQREEKTVQTGFEQDILSERAQLFPDTIDSLTYLIDLPCKTPTKGVLTSAFGVRTDPINGQQKQHYGIDLAAEEGTPIYAVAAGVVQETGENSYGKYIVLDHGDGLQSLYAHCCRLDVAEGDVIQSGTQIAGVGRTGRATGNHLHFELWRAGKILDPTPYLELT